MYHTILVPLDGSAFGEYALPFAADIARRTGSALHLVHVHVPDLPLTVDAVPIYDIERENERRSHEHAYLEQIAARAVPEGDLDVTTALLDGPVAETLHIYIAEHAIDLVALATHGRGAFSRLWLGSVADQIARHTQVPVLLVRPPAARPDHPPAVNFSHVLIPLDGSPLAEQIIPHALALGMGRTRYTLVQAIAPPVGAYGTELYSAGVDEQLLEQWRAAAQEYLTGVAGRWFSPADPPRTEVMIGMAAPSILDCAREVGAGVIALATHGRGGLARALLGSVADKVVRAADVPVLLYRPREAARDG